MLTVYHHNDMDGKAAGFLVHKLKPNGIEDSPEKDFMINYGDTMNKHGYNDDVFIVDLSFTKDTYSKLLEVCKTARSVTWIDHHASSVDVIAQHFDELQSIKNLTYFVSTAACGAALTYCYFMIPREELLRIRKTSDNETYDIKATYEKGVVSVTLAKANKKDPSDSTFYSKKVILPMWLFHVDDYDCWKKIDPKTEFFMNGCDTLSTSVTILDKARGRRVFNNFWNSLYTNSGDVIKYIEIGKTVTNYINSMYKRQMIHTFEWEFQGHKFLCKNGYGNSKNFGDLIEKYEAVILFYYSGKSGKWYYSCYRGSKSKFECNKFCEQFGGGGHPGAAGFESEQLIFTSKALQNVAKKENVIFLGGTWNGSTWRQVFIDLWKKSKDPVTKQLKLFDPIVPEWTPECAERENEVKEKAALNLFVITPEAKGFYSPVEALECAHEGSKVMFVLYDVDNQFDKSTIKSFDAIGKLIEKHGGRYKVYIKSQTEEDNGSLMQALVNDVIAFV